MAERVVEACTGSRAPSSGSRRLGEVADLGDGVLQRDAGDGGIVATTSRHSSAASSTLRSIVGESAAELLLEVDGEQPLGHLGALGIDAQHEADGPQQVDGDVLGHRRAVALV